jgi:hypothetical protein
LDANHVDAGVSTQYAPDDGVVEDFIGGHRQHGSRTLRRLASPEPLAHSQRLEASLVSRTNEVGLLAPLREVSLDLGSLTR